MTGDARRALTRLLNAFENHFDIARDGDEADDAALEAPDEYVEPFHDILLATAGRPGAAALRDALHTWVGMLASSPRGCRRNAPPTG